MLVHTLSGMFKTEWDGNIHRKLWPKQNETTISWIVFCFCSCGSHSNLIAKDGELAKPNGT